MPEANVPIFIVGAPRSGTTLLAALLGGHSRIACGPETQFFNKLAPKELSAAARDRAWPRRAVRSVSSLRLAGQPVIDLFSISERELWDDLAQRPPGVASMLESLTATLAARAEKPRWAEKTPNHLLHLDQIRAEWPTAPVIRIVRDPRDSAASMRRLPWASDSVLANAQLWAEWHEAGRGFFGADETSTTVKFEDLVRNPEQELDRLCGFLGERYEPSMLDTREAGALVSSQAEVWKEQVSGPIDRGHVARWKETMSPQTAACVSVLCQEGLREFGYEAAGAPARGLKVLRLDRQAIERNEAAMLAMTRSGWRPEPSRRPLRDRRLATFPAGRTQPGRFVERLALVSLRRLAGLETLRIGDGLLERPLPD